MLNFFKSFFKESIQPGKKIAALDLGSNTFLLLIVELTQDGKELYNQPIEDLVTITRIAEGVHENREFSTAALKRAEECFKKYSEVIKENNVDVTVAVATSAARDVKNKDVFFELGEKYNIPIKVIPGSLEAKLSFEGTTHNFYGLKDWIGDLPGTGVIDVGGGSTEVITKSEANEIISTSLDVGSVRLTEMFIDSDRVSKEQIEKMESYVIEKINESKLKLSAFKQIMAVAGTPTTLACIEQKTEFFEEVVDGYVLDIKRLEETRDSLAAMSLEERKQVQGLEPKRADVIVAGSTILLTVAKCLKVDKIEVSTKGVRYGLAFNWDKVLNHS